MGLKREPALVSTLVVTGLMGTPLADLREIAERTVHAADEQRFGPTPICYVRSFSREERADWLACLKEYRQPVETAIAAEAFDAAPYPVAAVHWRPIRLVAIAGLDQYRDRLN